MCLDVQTLSQRKRSAGWASPPPLQPKRAQKASTTDPCSCPTHLCEIGDHEEEVGIWVIKSIVISYGCKS